MSNDKKENHLGASRRDFLKQSATALAGVIIVPRYVLGGNRPDGSRYIAPSDIISLGFIGCGKQGGILSNFFLSTNEIKIRAVSEVYKDKTEQMLNIIKKNQEKYQQGGNLNDIGVYTDFRELLSRKDIDAVVIATPDHWHAAMAVRAAEAGKDIYCEKPLSLTVKEGRAMVNATRKNNRIFQTGSMQRSWPEFRQAVELVRNGYIGEIKSIKVNIGAPPIAYNLAEEVTPAGLDWKKWLGPNEFKPFNSELAPPITKDVYPNWRLYKEFGGGMVTDWGAHMFDIAQWALDMDNSGPTEVFAPDANHAFLTYKYKNNVIMTHEKWEWNNAVLFTGTEGEIRIGRGKLETTPASLKSQIIGDNQKHVYKSENHYKDFLNAMRTRVKPICDVETGHRTATVCNIGNIAYQLKRPLKWSPEKEKFDNDSEANALLGRPMSNEWGIKL
ncbi:Gfo/Idh/MocA family protein [Flavobacterium gilvum]|uniref:Oxidoreductase n=1 Tax=Flavobacterium gilvum TaxID=1492737 RepID=A0AAC9I5K5_9FLAO|nr:Gfo/Idh/MocA family oxidoreductase [Flavobacterium gilvum]AOW10095.1 oxidoreductase [Flavobacterium gilvum]KFC58368.1 oxidoreductase [Flavobacterium gilvum]